MKNFFKNKMFKALLGLSLVIVIVGGVFVFNTQIVRSAVSDNICNVGDATITTPAALAAVGGTTVTVAWDFNGTDCQDNLAVSEVQTSHDLGASWATVATSANPTSTSVTFDSTSGSTPNDSDYQFRLKSGGLIINTTSYDDVIIDNTAPVLLSAVTADDNHNGKIDRVRVALTESIGMAATCGTTGWTVTADGSENLVVSVCTKFDATHLDLTLEEQDIVGTEDTPEIAYNSGTGDTTDQALNEITTGTIANAVDDAAPAVNITAPLTTEKVNASKVITFTDSEITDPECSVNGGTNWTNCTAGTTLNGIPEFAALPQGAFTLSFRDTDALANVGGDSEADIIKDTTVPVIGVAGIVGTTIPGAGDTIAITFTDTNAVSAVDGNWADKDEITSITGTSSGLLDVTNATFSYSAPTLTITLDEATDHEYLTNGETLHVVPTVSAIQDAAGNFVAITEVEGTPVVTGDTTAPTVDLTYTTESTTYKHNDAVTITATFDEEVYGAGTGTVPQITIVSPGDGDVTLADMVISGVTHEIWTYAWTVGDGDGTATVTIVAKDYAGTANIAATNATKIVDNTLPVVAFTADNVEVGPVQTDTIGLAITETNPNTALNHYAFSADPVCDTDGTDTYDQDFTSGEAFIIDSDGVINGTYICGKAVDLAGNIGYSVASTNALNIDDVLPIVSAITLPAGATYKIAGDIQVGITADAVGYTAHAITVNGKDVAASLTSEGAGIYHVHYIVAENDTDVLAAGKLTASVVLEDGVGNNNVAFETVTEGAGDVIVDAHKPTLATVLIASNNAHDTTYAKTGNLVTLTFIAGENLAATPVVTIRGHAADSVTQDGDAQHWTATYTMIEGDTTGVVPFTINFTDIATNAGTEVTAVTEGSGVTFDKTLPVVAITGDVLAGPINSDAVTLGVTETNPDIATYYYAFSADAVCDTDGTDTYDQVYVSTTPFTFDTADHNGKYICGKAVDMAGNIGYSAASAFPLNIDIITPTGYSVNIGQAYINDANKAAASFTFAVAEVTATYNYSITSTGGGAAVTGTGTIDDVSDVIAIADLSGLGDGTLTLSVTLTDVATNLGSAVTDTVVKDVTNPASVATIANALYGTTTYIANTVNGTASDIGGTGVATVTITIQEGAGNYWDGDSWEAGVTNLPVVGTTTWTYNSSTAITHTNALVYTVTPTTTDTAGNSVAGTADTYTWDGTIPTISNYNSNKDNGSYKVGVVIDVDVTFSEAITTASAITLTLDSGGTCVIASVSSSSTATCDYTVGTEQTSADLTVSNFSAAGAITDQAGNIMLSFDPTGNNLAANKVIIIDTTAPDVNMGTSPGTKTVTWNQNTTVTDTNMAGIVYLWTAPLAPYAVTFGTNNAEDTTISAGGIGYYTVQLTATDVAGNVGTGTVSFTWNSTNVPISSYSPINGATGVAIAAGNASITFGGSENITLIDPTKVTIVKDSDDSDVSNGAVSVSGASKILLVPHIALANSTVYRINILAGAIRDASGHINSDGVSYFTTVAATGDTTSPVSISMAPTTVKTNGNAMNVQFVFNDVGFTGAVGEIVEFSMDGAPITATATSLFEQVFTINYTTGTWTTGTHNFTIKVKDATGNETSRTLVVVVNAAGATDATIPTIEDFGPDDDATGVAIDSYISVLFSEVMDSDTCLNANAHLWKTSGDDTEININAVECSATFTLGGVEKTSMYITPTSDLLYGETYSLVIDNTVTDWYGNPFAGLARGTYSFATISEETEPDAGLTVDTMLTHTGITNGDWDEDGNAGEAYEWVFGVTLPSDESYFALQFSDWTNGLDTANNMRYWSEDVTAGVIGSATNPRLITAENAYPQDIRITGDASDWATGGQAGIQTNIHVQLEIPGTTPAGSHSASFLIRTDADGVH